MLSDPAWLLNQNYESISQTLDLKAAQVAAVESLVEEGATVPFIARYRKEKTGGLDEVKISDILDRLEAHNKLQARRKTILASLEEQGIQEEKLLHSIQSADNLANLEDLYLPYRPKRRTWASIAREKGLEPSENLHDSQVCLCNHPFRLQGTFPGHRAEYERLQRLWGVDVPALYLRPPRSPSLHPSKLRG